MGLRRRFSGVSENLTVSKTLESKVAAQTAKLVELNEKEKQLTEKLDLHLPEIEKTLHDIQTAFKTDVENTKSQTEERFR